MKNSILTLCSLAVLTSLLNQPAFAQDTSSAIRGKITNANGSPISDAMIMIEDTRTGSIRTLTSNSTGTFLASQLPVGGPYRVTVNDSRTVVVDSIELGDIYSLSINMASQAAIEEMVVMGQSQDFVDVAAGPAATFSSFELGTAVAFNRDIKDAYSIDPRINIDEPDRGGAVNCMGKHPRFNNITLDGVSQNDRFGLNDNGYSTATGMPFPYDVINQVAVEFAPFDVTYGGFSACNVNAVTKSGSNTWEGNVFYEWTSNDLRGDTVGLDSGDITIESAAYDERQKGFSIGGPVVADRLFFYAAYEEAEEPRFISQGYAGSGSGDPRDWLSEADYNRIRDIAINEYNYDPGTQPGNGAQEQEKMFLRMDWMINDLHSASLIYNEYSGIQDRASDGDSSEFEFSNHFYVKGSDVESLTLMLRSQWTDSFSTEFFYNQSEMEDLQETVGPKDFADIQIDVGTNVVYLGADDSRQTNSLGTESDYLKLTGQYLWRDHVLTGGYEQEELSVANTFVQHSRGGEIDFDSIDDFEAGTPRRYYYGSGGGSNNPQDAAAGFSATQNTVYLQDEYVFYDLGLTLTAGLRYDWYSSSDNPTRNINFENAYGFRNDSNIDGIDLLMPRLGFTWEATEKLSVRGGLGLYSGGNPTVWISNAWSNDGITNVQRSNSYDGATESLLDGSIALSGSGQPGRDVPQDLIDQVAAVDPDAGLGSIENLVLVSPSYKLPSEWKYALGGTYYLDNGWTLDSDVVFSSLSDQAIYEDISQEIVGQTAAGQPIYDYAAGLGEDNLMLTNANKDGSAVTFSLLGSKSFDFGLDLNLGYAFTKAEDVSSMTSFTAGTSWFNLATNDINNPQLGTSNYEVPHRFTIRASYGNEFISGYETRITAYLERKSGQPGTYVMTSGGLEGNGSNRRHLLYVPTGPSDPNVIFDPAFDQAAFFQWIDSKDLNPGFVDRNEHYASWSTRMDLRLDQELPTFLGDSKGRFFLKVYNFLNLLNDDWGKQYDAQFFSVEAVSQDLDTATGRYVFEEFNGGSVTDLKSSNSLWEARMGIEFRF